MTTIFENKLIIENRDAQNLSYILEDESLFFNVGYKVLKNQEKNGFVKCAQVLHNGKIKLVYDISGYKSLESLLPALSCEKFAAIISNLVDILLGVKGNGFIQCENIGINFEQVFVEHHNFKVYMVYLPVDVPLNHDSYLQFENRLRENMLNAIEANENLHGDSLAPLLNFLKSTSCSIELIKECLASVSTCDEPSPSPEPVPELELTELVDSVTKTKRGLFSQLFTKKEKKPPKKTTVRELRTEAEGGATEILDEIFIPTMVFAGVNTPEKIEFVLGKPEFLLGKKADAVDGVLKFNSAISRVHCKIISSGNDYYIVDLGSANGTYVNENRLAPNQQTIIRPGDKLRLANSHFTIKQI